MTKEVLLFTKLYNFIRGWLESREYYMAVKALDFAKQRHTGIRKDGVTPEFSHQLHIVRFFINLAKLVPNPQRLIVLILLHDVVEDDYATLDDIRQNFGDDIAHGVRLLSKQIGSVAIKNEQYYNPMVDDPDVCIAKGGDRLHNLESMVGVFTPERQLAYADETEAFTLPMLKKARAMYPEYSPIINTIRHIMIIYVKNVRAGLEHMKVKKT